MPRHSNRRETQDELPLESGQVTTLVVGSILALGVVFLLGVGFGKHLAKGVEVPAMAEAAVVALEALPEAPELTFHDTLTAKKAPAPQAAPAPEPEPEPTAAPRPEPAVAERPAAPAAPAPRPELNKPEPKPAVAAEGANRLDGPTGGFTVQVASSQDRGDTEKLVAKVRAEGYSARIVSAEIPGRGTWHRVRVGHFESREDASLKQAELKLAMGLSGIVVAN